MASNHPETVVRVDPPRYEVRRLPDGDFILFDSFTQARVDMVGPWQVASEATRRAGYYNRAWESLPAARVYEDPFAGDQEG